MKNRAKKLGSSYLRFFFAACAVTLLSGFSIHNETRFPIVDKCTSPGVPLNCVEEDNSADTPDGTKSKESDTDYAVGEGSKSGFSDGAVEKLLLFFIFLLTACGIYLFLKGLMQKRGQGSYSPTNRNLPPTATYRNSPAAQAPVQNRPKVSPGNLPKTGTAYPTQTPRVERETIELVSPVEAKTDSTITAEPEQTQARVRPNLVPIGLVDQS